MGDTEVTDHCYRGNISPHITCSSGILATCTALVYSLPVYIHANLMHHITLVLNGLSC